MTDAGTWASWVLDAEVAAEAVAPITDVEPSLTVEEAYEIQEELIRLRVARGETIIGAKLGLTSKAKQLAMGLDEPIYGVLTDAMLLPIEQPVTMAEHIHPRVEPEIVFVLAHDLAGPGVTIQDVLAATGSVCSGLEIIDSRFADFRFTLPDVIADNTSASRFVLGPVAAEPSFDLSMIGCVFEVDGSVVGTTAGAAILGHPAEAVAQLANWLGRRGGVLRAGWKIMSGGLMDAMPLHAGRHALATFSRLGRVGVRAT